MSCGRFEYRRIGFIDDPNTCDLSILRYFVNSNKGKFLDAKTGIPYEELERIYNKRELESHRYKIFG